MEAFVAGTGRRFGEARAFARLHQSPVGGEQLDEVRALCTGVVMTVRAYPMIHAQELLVRVAGTT